MKYVANCPECNGGWTLVELVSWAQELTLSYDEAAECPRCHIKTVWSGNGEISTQSKSTSPEWVGKRGEPELILCACGCGEKFNTTKKGQYYKNNAHRTRGKRKGLIVDSSKRNRNVRSRERTNGG